MILISQKLLLKNYLLLFYSRNFEKSLMTSARQLLNVIINPMDPVINCFLSRSSLAEIKTSIGIIFTKQKACNTELIAVVIPDYPDGIYGE